MYFVARFFREAFPFTDFYPLDAHILSTTNATVWNALQDLLEAIDSKLDEDLHEAVAAILLPPSQADARSLYLAMKVRRLLYEEERLFYKK